MQKQTKTSSTELALSIIIIVLSVVMVVLSGVAVFLKFDVVVQGETNVVSLELSHFYDGTEYHDEIIRCHGDGSYEYSFYADPTSDKIINSFAPKDAQLRVRASESEPCHIDITEIKLVHKLSGKDAGSALYYQIYLPDDANCIAYLIN